MPFDTRPLAAARHGTGGPARARAQVPAAPPAADFVLHFEHGSERLPDHQLDALRRWTAAWMDHEPDGMFVMGCTAPVHRSARVARLRTLRSLLARQGIADERIRYTGDAIEPPGDAAAGVQRAVMARLKLIRARHAERQVCSIRSMFDAGLGGRGGACTSAS